MRHAEILGGLAALVASSAFAQPAPLDLSLICEGSGVLTVTEVDDNGTIGKVTDDKQRDRRSNVSGRVRLRFSPAESAIKIPATMGGNPDKWERLTNLTYDDNRISAERRRLIWRTKIVVDRRTGEVEINGGDLAYSGTCTKAPEEAEARKF